MRWQLTKAAPVANGTADEAIKRHLILTRLQDIVAWGRKELDLAVGGRAARARRHLLITVLHAVQEGGRLDQPGRA